MPTRRSRTLLDEVAARFPELDDPAGAIDAGQVLVNGLAVTNRASIVRSGTSVALRSAQPMRGAVKLRAALDGFGISARGLVALDLGAAAGGFTSVLLERGAARVYAVDVGHGQLLGSLRQDPRVVNLEATNLAGLDERLVPEQVRLITIDLSNLAVARAVPQLRETILAAAVDLVALIKPMFELSLPYLPTSEEQLADAVDRAARGVEAAGWNVADRMRSPALGAHGAVEFFIHARRASAGGCTS